jgi:hypothetical protein
MTVTVEFFAEITDKSGKVIEFEFQVKGTPTEHGGFDYEYGGFCGTQSTSSQAEIEDILYCPVGGWMFVECPEWMKAQVLEVAQEHLEAYEFELVEEWDL